MYHPEISCSTLYHHFKSYLHWDWLNNNLAHPKLLLCNNLSLPMASHFNPEQPAFISIINQKNINLFLTYFFSTDAPCKQMPALLVVSDNQEQFLLHQLSASTLADINIPMLSSPQSAQACLDNLLPYCYQQLSPRIIQHGTFIHVMGKGILLTGDSGVGKSLAALYCLNNNHALIADDAPFFYKSGTQLIGGSPTKLANLLEIRNLGIIDVSQNYGPQFVHSMHTLDLIINLTSLPPKKRLVNISHTTENILGIPIPKLPLAFTENITILIENAVRYLYTNQIYNS
jgi:HPr kinase/phosphorylase